MKFNESDIKKMVTEAINRVIKENLENELIGFHGTIHDFDKFDTSFIGTGESSQAYGWGLYLSGLRETGDFYAAIIANKNNSGDKNNEWLIVCKEIQRVMSPFIKRMRKEGIPFINIKSDALQQLMQRNLPRRVIEMFSCVFDEQGYMKFNAYIQKMAAAPYKKFVYTVEIPDEGFIDWNSTDKGLIENIYSSFAKEFDVSHVRLNFINTFGELYSALCGTRNLFDLKPEKTKIKPMVVSKFLKKLGFNGISVPIGNRSGDKNIGKNYVVFDADDIKIVKKEAI